MKFHAALLVALAIALPLAAAEPLATVNRETSAPVACAENVTCTTSTTTASAGVLGASASSAITTESCEGEGCPPPGHGHTLAASTTQGGASLGYYAGEGAATGASAGALGNAVVLTDEGSAYAVSVGYAGHEVGIVGANGDFTLILA